MSKKLKTYILSVIARKTGNEVLKCVIKAFSIKEAGVKAIQITQAADYHQGIIYEVWVGSMTAYKKYRLDKIKAESDKLTGKN